MGTRGDDGFFPPHARLSKAEIAAELVRIEAEYEELEKIAGEMLYGRTSFSASKFMLTCFVSRLRRAALRYETVSKAAARLRH